jgi:hypothetical protein
MRLRVDVYRPGVLVVTSEDRATLFSGAVRPGTPVIVPQDLTMGARERRVLDLTFSPLSLLPMAEVRPMRGEFRAREQQAAARAQGLTSDAARELSLSLQIILRRKP